MGNSKSSKSVDVTNAPGKKKGKKNGTKKNTDNSTTNSVPTNQTNLNVDSAPNVNNNTTVDSTPGLSTSAVDSAPLVSTPTVDSTPVVNPLNADSIPVENIATVDSTPLTSTLDNEVSKIVINDETTANADNAAAKVAASKMPVTLYHVAPSPPCRAIRLLAKVIGLELDLKVINIMNGENFSSEFVKLNPTATVPTINDNGFVIWESRAILAYLVDSYAKNDSLYPKDPQARAQVDQKLFFDIGTLFPPYLKYYMPTIFRGIPLDPENLKDFEKGMGFLNTLLDGLKYVAGNQMTIADLSIIPTISNVEAFGYDLGQYPNIDAWYARMKQALAPYDYEEINQTGANILGNMLKSRLG